MPDSGWQLLEQEVTAAAGGGAVPVPSVAASADAASTTAAAGATAGLRPVALQRAQTVRSGSSLTTCLP